MLISNPSIDITSPSRRPIPTTQEFSNYGCPPESPIATKASSKPQDEDIDKALKAFEEHEATIREGNVLMVDQLWLWALDERTIVTFFPKKEAVFSEGTLYQQGDLHNDIYNEVNSGLDSVPDAETFAALIVQRAVTILLDRTAHRHLQILRIYEESLSILVWSLTFVPSSVLYD